MILKPPFIITARLQAGVNVGGAFISLRYDGSTPEGRTRYAWSIDMPGGEYGDNDLKSGCGGGDLKEGFVSLLSFLSAAAESYKYDGMEGENSDLFPEAVTHWASLCSDEIDMLRYEIEESEEELIEE